MYFHVLVSTDETGENYEFDNPELEEIVENVVRPYIENREFQFVGYFLEPSKVRRIMITQTDFSTGFYLNIAQVKRGALTKREDYVFKEGN